MFRGLKSILRLLFRHKRRLVLGIGCLLLVDAGQLVIPLIIREVIDGLAAASVTVDWLGRQALVLAGLALGIAGFRFLWRHFLFTAARLAELDLRQSIYDHTQRLSTVDFTETRTGKVMALAINDVNSVRQVMAMGFVAGIDSLIYTVVGISAIFWLQPGIALYIVLPLPLLAVLMKVALKAVYERWDKVQAAFETMTERARESIAGVRVVKAFVQEEGDARRFETTSRDYFDKFMHYTRIDALFHPVILLLTGSCMAILLGLGGAQVIEGEMSVGTLVALSSYLGMLTWPMIAAGWLFTLLQRSAASMARIEAFLDKPPQTDPPGAEELPAGGGGRIEVRDLTFTFPGGKRPALTDVSFEIPDGGSLGLVGEIGSGKSALVQLLMRLYEPPEGSVFVEGRDVRDLQIASLREAISLVPQEAFLFSDSIAENLRIGNPDASETELREVAALSALDEEIDALDDGYETLLGERGITLSGGQRQRMCLARALLKAAPILLLDDTLSAVDAETERRILETLGQAVTGRTTLVVSHRVSAVRGLDRVLVLHEGRVVDAGTHDELVARPGRYRRMAELQDLLGSS